MYRDFQGLELSMLGLGTMRLPVLEQDSSKIDEAAAFAMFDYAIEHGVNYFDTAWGYHGGNSEIVTGKALKRYDRDSFYIATKFPTYDTSNFGKHEEIFAKQLEKLQMDYVDFYLLHNVCEVNIEQYLQEEKYHTIEYSPSRRRRARFGTSAFPSTGAGTRSFALWNVSASTWSFAKSSSTTSTGSSRRRVGKSSTAMSTAFPSS